MSALVRNPLQVLSLRAQEAAEVLRRFEVPDDLREIVLVLAADARKLDLVTQLVRQDAFPRLAYELQALDPDQLLPCHGCGEDFPHAQLVSSRGGTGYFCATCYGPEDKRYQRKLERRSIRSVISRARAAHRPATLTAEEWEATTYHFNGLCAYCQRGPWFVVDLATPVDLGGGATRDNCLPACYACNVAKGKGSLESVKPWETLKTLGENYEASGHERLQELCAYLGKQRTLPYVPNKKLLKGSK